MRPTRLLILGAGRFAADVADWASEIPGVTPIGFYCDRQASDADELDGLPIFTERRALDELPPFEAVCAVGSADRLSFIETLGGWGVRFSTLVHPTARVSRKATVAVGSVIAPFAQIAAHAALGEHVIVNRGAAVAHDVEIGDYAFIGPGAVIAGSVIIASRVIIGAGAVVRDRVRVGEGATVGIGSVAVKDVAAGSTVFGVPAKPLPVT